MRVVVSWGAALVLCCASAHAADIRVTSGACGEPVRLVARDAPLSSVLKRLGESLGFSLVYQSQRDPAIARDLRLPPVDLVRELAQGTNFSVEQVKDPRCSSAMRVAKVLVLPDQGEKTPTPIAKQNVYTPEMERIARQGLSDYLKSHGMEDSTIEAMAVK